MNGLAEILQSRGDMPWMLEIEKRMQESGEACELPVEHYRIPGVYVRCLFIPKGTWLVGKIHNAPKISVLLKGKLDVTDGLTTVTITAPNTTIDAPGTKRMCHALEDSLFLNIHHTHESDLNLIEEELVSDTFKEFEQKYKGDTLCLGLS
jgi:hypothetical protein